MQSLGEPITVLWSSEEVTYSDLLVNILYEMALLLLLAEKLRAVIMDIMQMWYADVSGHHARNACCHHTYGAMV